MDDDTPKPVRRFQASDLVVLTLDLVTNLIDAIGQTGYKAYNVAAMHANWRHEQRRFHQEAAQAIESITESTDG